MNKEMPAPAGIYIHIPFCGGKCAYCDFYSVPGRGTAAMEGYAQALLRHFREFAAENQAEIAGLTFDTVYFGGGTPSMLGAELLCQLLDGVQACFPLENGAEITLEANPGELCDLSRLRAAGFNRLSLGLQSARDDELRVLGRRHDFAQARQAAEAARAAGVDNLSLDLIYGLPGQTLERWRESVEAVCALEPEHISAYSLSLSPEVPLYARRDELPDDESQLAMYLYLVERLAAGGWGQYEVSNFAKPGKTSRHNGKYWTGAAYFGFGPGAHSFFGGVRYAAPADLAAWMKNPGFGPGEPITARDRVEEYLMLRLRLTEGIRESAFMEQFGLDFAPFAAVLEKYIPHGLVLRENNRWALTPRGLFVSNALISELFGAIQA